MDDQRRWAPASQRHAFQVCLLIDVFRNRLWPDFNAEAASVQLLMSLRIPLHELVDQKQCGEGNFSIVYRAGWRGAPVVVKKPKNALSTDDVKELLTMAQACSSNNPKPNLACFLGYCWPEDDNTKLWFVLAEARYGSLDKLLEADEKRLLQTPECLQAIFQDLALGLNELHRQTWLHRDIATRNFLVNERGRLLLSDFGLARRLDAGHKDFVQRGVACVPAMQPPETKDSPELISTRETDVWMLGSAFLSILSGGADADYRELWAAASPSDIKIPDHCPQNLRSVIRLCLQSDPAKRPSADHLCMLLSANAKHFDTISPVRAAAQTLFEAATTTAISS